MSGRPVVALLLLIAGSGLVLIFLAGDWRTPDAEEAERIRAEAARLEGEGQYDEALAQLDPLVRTARPAVEDLLLAGRIEVARGSDPRRAEIFFRRAVEMAPDDPAARQALLEFLAERE